MQLVRTWFYYEYCCRVYLAYSVVGTRDPEVWRTLIHAWRRFLSVPRRFTWCLLWSIIVLLLLLYTIHLGWDTLAFHVCVTPFSCKELFVKKHSAASKKWYYWRTVKQLPRVERPSDLRSATIYIEVRCMVSYILEGGGKFHRHQPRERHYIHGCTWYIWLLCAQWWAV